MFLKDEHFTFFRSISFPLSCIMERNLYPLPLAVCVCMPPHGAILRVNASFHLLFPFLQCENSFPSDYWGEVAAAAASFQKMTLKKVHHPPTDVVLFSVSPSLFSLSLHLVLPPCTHAQRNSECTVSIPGGREGPPRKPFQKALSF